MKLKSVFYAIQSTGGALKLYGIITIRYVSLLYLAPNFLPPPPTATDEYSSLQHDLGGGGGPHQVVDQDQHVYDSAQGDLPQYSTIAQQVSRERYMIQ